MKTIGIIGAMPSELADIRKSLTGAVIKNYSGFDFYINTYKDKLIINACCGIAKVNAAVCTQVMIDHFDVDAIINTGVAGGMDTKVKVCDIVVSDEVLPHDLELRLLNDYPPYNGIFKADEKLISILVKCAKKKILTVISDVLFPVKLLFQAAKSKRLSVRSFRLLQLIWKPLQSVTVHL